VDDDVVDDDRLSGGDAPLVGKTEMLQSKEIDFDKIVASFLAKSKMEAGGSKTAAPPAAQLSPADIDELKKKILPHVTAKISGAAGMHNVFFVFKNNKAAANQLLMQVIEIDFEK
jgi:hypothetical protein